MHVFKLFVIITFPLPNNLFTLFHYRQQFQRHDVIANQQHHFVFSHLMCNVYSIKNVYKNILIYLATIQAVFQPYDSNPEALFLLLGKAMYF
jgi:hypothetical protein